MPAPDQASSNLEIRLFGPFDVRVNGHPLPRLRTRKGQWLLALLALRHDRDVDRHWLAGTLWPDSPESQARYNLRRSLMDLRQALGEHADHIRSPDSNTLHFSAQAVSVDVLAFDQAILCGEGEALEKAVALYAGPLLEGCGEEWVVSERAEREQRYLEALEKRANEAAGRADDLALSCLRTLLGADPLRESAQRLLMQTLAQKGEIAAAIQAFRDFRLHLLRELNASPAPETIALYQRIRSDTRQRVITPPKEEPLRTARSPRRLPRPATPLIGREEELLQVERLLSAGRLLTLTGTGGVGKTRLAIQAAEQVGDEYAGGVWFVDLSLLTTPTLVVQSIATTLDIQEKPGQALLTTLTESLQPRRLLLVLDNCEHLLAESARVVSSLAQHCPELRVLATSRQPLGLRGEVVLRVPALSLPDPQYLTAARADPLILEQESAAFRLFVEHAAGTTPRFLSTAQNAPSIARICRYLDGIPLAIELTASCVRGLSVEQIAARLSENYRPLTGGSRPGQPRQQTLQAAIDWSHSLLSEAEKALFRRLSVFAGGFTLETAEAILDFEFRILDCPKSKIRNLKSKIQNGEVLELLLELVDKSLIVFEEQEGKGRYRLLETIRQYGLERLAEAGEVLPMQAHFVAYFLALVEEAGSRLKDTGQRAAMQRLVEERDNLRVAMTWPSDEGTISSRLRMAHRLLHFWLIQGAGEGCDTLTALLDQDRTDPPTQTRAWALNALGVLERWKTDYTGAYRHLKESLAVQRALGNREGEAACLGNLASVLEAQEDYAASRSLHEESLAIYRELGSKWSIAAELNGLGVIPGRLGDMEAAERYFREGVDIMRDLGDRWGIAHQLLPLGSVCFEQGDYETAKRLHGESLTLFQQLDDRLGIALALEGFARLLATARPEAAACLFGATEALRNEVGVPVPPYEQAVHTSALARIRAVIGEERCNALRAEGQERPLDLVIADLLKENTEPCR